MFIIRNFYKIFEDRISNRISNIISISKHCHGSCPIVTYLVDITQFRAKNINNKFHKDVRSKILSILGL